VSANGVVIPIVAARPAPAMPSGCASGGCGGHDAPANASGPRPVQFNPVRVNGVEIAPAAIAQEAQQHPAPDGTAAWMAAARALVLRELMLGEARRLGIEFEAESDAMGRREVEDEALIRALLEREAAAAVPTDAECRRYYDANVRRFRTPELLEAAHILIEPASDGEVGWAAAEREARTIAEQVGDDREAFAEAARTFSKCPSARQDGMLGQVRRGELLPAVQTALEALGEGVTRREPVRSRFGWHVLRLERRIAGRELPYEHVAQRIADMLEARSWAMAGARYAAKLVAAASVEGVAFDFAPWEGGTATLPETRHDRGSHEHEVTR
jgi:peptidyl-prolyl cis-trans isomerase C